MRLTNLRVNAVDRPYIGERKPFFSWIMESEDKDVCQTDYQITVMDESGEIYWDSGVVNSEASLCIEYEGRKLKSCYNYLWTVKCRDNKGNVAREKSSFETAIFEKNEWKSIWVASPFPLKERADGFGNQQRAVLFRKKIHLSKKVQMARIYATCHGLYQLSINGKRADEREFAPEHTSYDKYLCYQVYDVTKKLRKGENVIGMHVGSGWYPERNKIDKSASDEAAILFQLLVRYADGSTELIVTDGTEKSALSPVLSSYLFTGELYDARVEKTGWDSPGYDIGSEWKSVVIKPYDMDNLVCQTDAPVMPYSVLPVKEKLISLNGETILDFGQVIAGRIRMDICQSEGTKVGLEYFEVLDKEGNCFDTLFTNTENGQCQREVYICNGIPSHYEGHFAFYGFRYVKVTGINPKDINIQNFLAVCLSSQKENTGSFICSDEKINRLYENTRWSQTTNMLSVPTDCPQREKAGWTGDIAMYCRTALENEDVTAFLTRWLDNLRCDQGKYGEIPMTVPYDGAYPQRGAMIKALYPNSPDGESASAGWGDAAVIVPYTIYERTGNIAILKRQYLSMKCWTDYVVKNAKERREGSSLPDEIEQYLWNTGFHFGEWLIPSQSKEGYNLDGNPFKICETTSVYTAPIFGWNTVRLMAQTAKLLKENADYVYYNDLESKMKKAIQQGLIGENGERIPDYMGAYVLLLYFDLVPQRLKENVALRLTASLEKNNYCLDTGFLATPYLLPALEKIGRNDLAYRVLRQKKAPSWMYEVEHGATTIWESWYSFDEDMQPLKLSFNHYAYGTVDDWIFENIGGITMLSPGYKEILFRPQPDQNIKYAKRSYRTPYGIASCEWKKENGCFFMDICVPVGTKATAVLPDGSTHMTGSGSYHFKVQDI
ncbi:MAG: family 78 glycoside hydrolase catalytic domain [Eubacteriales bacterium]|nr:family 78 glycoside hydrolase catalytic domain [Eubacteriales bacterium]